MGAVLGQRLAAWSVSERTKTAAAEPAGRRRDINARLKRMAAANDHLYREALTALGDAMDKAMIVARPDGTLHHTNRRARALLGWEELEDAPAAGSLESIPVSAELRARLQRDPGP